MKHLWRSAALLLVVACSDGVPPDGWVSVDGPFPHVGATNQTLRLNITGIGNPFESTVRWFRQHGDYIKKIAGDSFEVRLGGYPAVKVPASAVTTDNSGGVRVVDSASIRHIRIDIGSGVYRYIRNVGDVFRVLNNTTGTTWAHQTNTDWRAADVFEADASGDARMAACTASCGSIKAYDGYIIELASPATINLWPAGAQRIDGPGDYLVGGWTTGIIDICSTASPDYGWAIRQAGPDLGARAGWAYATDYDGYGADGYEKYTDWTSGGSYGTVGLTCYDQFRHDWNVFQNSHQYDSSGTAEPRGTIRIVTPDGTKYLGGGLSQTYGTFSAGYVSGFACSGDLLRFSVVDTSGTTFGPYTGAQLGGDAGALRVVLGAYKDLQCP